VFACYRLCTYGCARSPSTQPTWSKVGLVVVRLVLLILVLISVVVGGGGGGGGGGGEGGEGGEGEGEGEEVVFRLVLAISSYLQIDTRALSEYAAYLVQGGLRCCSFGSSDISTNLRSRSNSSSSRRRRRRRRRRSRSSIHISVRMLSYLHIWMRALSEYAAYLVQGGLRCCSFGSSDISTNLSSSSNSSRRRRRRRRRSSIQISVGSIVVFVNRHARALRVRSLPGPKCEIVFV